MVQVVAGIIKDKENKIFIAQRNLKKSQGGLWEFPGGKIEVNESREHALIRELQEELDITVEVNKYVGEKTFEYPDKLINLIAFECKIISGEVKLEEHEDSKWVRIEELKNFKFSPSDEFIVEILEK